LQKKLKTHAVIFDKKEKGWSYVGDLGYIRAGLMNINEFLK
jgi:hypothetical protein